MIGNFPILLINRPTIALPTANMSSKMKPFSSVDSSSLVVQTF